MEKNKTKHQYGLISMVSIIIGTVIGSGIYVKNSSLIQTTQSSILSVIGWIIGGLLVIAILISMMEIASSTSKNNEQGTLGNWTRYFWGPKISRVISSYFLFVYFPLVIASEIIFSINQFFDGKTFDSDWSAFFIITIISVLFLIIIFIISSFFQKPTKVITFFGTIIKSIPLLMIIFIMIIVVFGATVGTVSSLNPIFDPSAEINSGMHDDKSNLAQITLILPAILFAFDGFLYSASLSTEAKSKNTYKTAAILSILFITIIYIFFSLSTYSLAEAGNITLTNGSLNNSSFTINSVVSDVFPNQPWILKTISLIISLSIIIAVFGYSTSSMWALSDASNNNEIVDKYGKLIRRNKSGNPYQSGIKILLFSIIGVLFMRFMDASVILLAFNGTVLGEGGQAYIGMSDFISNVYSLMNFGFYSFIIFGGIMNRFTKKVSVEKTRLFLVFALISVLGMGMIVIYMSYDILNNVFVGLSSNEDGVFLYICQLITAIIMIGIIPILYFIFSWLIKKQPNSVWENKLKYQNAYNRHLTFEDYVKTLK